MSETIEMNGYAGGPSELDKAVDSFITEMSTEFKDEALASEIEALDVAPADGASPAGESAPPEGNPAPAPEAPPAPEDRGVARLVEREVALRAREDSLSARESRAAELEAKIRELEARVIPPDLEQMFDTKPEEALRALKVDPDILVRQIIASRMGKTDDPQVKQVIADSKRDREIAALKQQLAERDRAVAAREFVTRVETGAREHVHKGLGEDAPTVAAVAKANPDRVYREIMEEISKDAQVKMARGVGGDVLSYDEAVKRVETRWAEFRSLVAPAQAAPATPPDASTKPEATNGAPVKKESPVSPTKPPDRPLAPWLQRGDLENEGIKAGMAEFRKLEKL